MSGLRKTALIIVNSVSGGKDKKPILEIIRKNFPKNIDHEIIIWERPGQKDEITKKIREGKYDIIVAAGGDGTINQVAQSVIGSDSTLAIIPLGSGNGLARHLNIPLDTQKAIELIVKGKKIQIDACSVNGINFFGTSGIGFDALIGKLFAKSKTRGFFTYFKLTFSNFIKYKPQQYSLTIDGKVIDTTAFLITFANASQYGNNAHIAPHADISDGYIDVVVLKPFKFRQAIFIAQKLFNKTLHLSKYVEVYKGENITVTRNSPGPIHFDGEPAEMKETIEYSIQKGAVNVIVI
jgi:diacylglycerol kinase (ATP)